MEPPNLGSHPGHLIALARFLVGILLVVGRLRTVPLLVTVRPVGNLGVLARQSGMAEMLPPAQHKEAPRLFNLVTLLLNSEGELIQLRRSPLIGMNLLGAQKCNKLLPTTRLETVNRSLVRVWTRVIPLIILLARQVSAFARARQMAPFKTAHLSAMTSLPWKIMTFLPRVDTRLRLSRIQVDALIFKRRTMAGKTLTRLLQILSTRLALELGPRTTKGICRTTVLLQVFYKLGPVLTSGVNALPWESETLKRLLHNMKSAPLQRFVLPTHRKNLVKVLLVQRVAPKQLLTALLLALRAKAPPTLLLGNGKRPEMATNPVQKGRGNRLRHRVDLRKNNPLPKLHLIEPLLASAQSSLVLKKQLQLKDPQIPL